MIGIGRKQRKERRSWVRGIADRDVQLISGYNFQRRVSIFPPELVSDDGNFESIARLRGVLNACDYARCRQEENHHNEGWNDRPREFQLTASVNLCWFAPLVRPPLPELYHCVGKQA